MTAAADLEAVVLHKERITDDVVAVTLADADGAELAEWEPGAHVDLVLGPDVVRQYSLCGDPRDRRVLRVAVLREQAGRGGSVHVHDRLAVGDTVRVRGPRNNFRLVDAPRYLFVAGGIGITPLLPMIAAVAAAGAPWRLVYGGRRRSSLAFAAELTARHPGRVELVPEDEAGLIPLAEVISGPDPELAVYCCGPEPLLVAVEHRCATAGVPGLHLERFHPTGTDGAGPDEPFDVELVLSGRVLTVPAGRSILDTLEEAGVQVDSSCRAGTCATCETGVVAGTPDHRDTVLSAAEQAAGETMMICVSRARGPKLVLDL